MTVKEIINIIIKLQPFKYMTFIDIVLFIKKKNNILSIKVLNHKFSFKNQLKMKQHKDY